jgi:hypothetical protein
MRLSFSQSDMFFDECLPPGRRIEALWRTQELLNIIERPLTRRPSRTLASRRRLTQIEQVGTFGVLSEKR